MRRDIRENMKWTIVGVLSISILIIGTMMSGCQKSVHYGKVSTEVAEDIETRLLDQMDIDQIDRDLVYLDSLAYQISILVYTSQDFRKYLYEAFSHSTERENKVRLDEIANSYPGAVELNVILSKMTFTPYVYIPCASFETWNKEPIPVVPAEVFDENAKEIYGYENGKKNSITRWRGTTDNQR